MTVCNTCYTFKLRKGKVENVQPEETDNVESIQQCDTTIHAVVATTTSKNKVNFQDNKFQN